MSRIEKLALVLLTVATAGCGSLLSATRAGDLESVKKRLAAGESPNVSDDDEWPLCVAVKDDRLDIAKMLLEAKARTDGSCSIGYTSYSPLCVAIVRHNMAMTKELLAAKASTDETCSFPEGRFHYGRLPLEYAVRQQDVELLKMLLAAGADYDLHPPAAHLLVTAALENDPDKLRITTLLLEHVKAKGGEAAMRAFLNGKRKSGEQNGFPLATAASAGNASVVEQLLAYGADPNARAYAGAAFEDEWPILFYAKLGKAPGKVVALLEKAGADANARSKNGHDFATVKAQHAKHSAEVEAQHEARLQEAAEERREREREDREEEKREQAASRAAFESYAQTIMGGGTSRSSPSPSSPSSPSSPGARASSSDGASTSTTPANRPTAAGTSGAPGRAPDKAGGDKAASDKGVVDRAGAQRSAEQAAADKAAADKAAAAERAESERRARADYLAKMRSGIRLRATKCPGGEGKVYVTGTKPSAKDAFCIDVGYQASCPADEAVSLYGVMSSFTGRAGCFTGETSELLGKLPCGVEQITVRVTDVTPCK